MRRPGGWPNDVKTAFAAVIFGAAARMVPAQGIPLATLGGRVRTEDGRGVDGATVVVQSSHLQGKRETTSFSNGEYVFKFLPPGDYIVRFTLAGMQSVEKSVALAAAGEGRLDATLVPAPVEEAVTVSGDAASGSPLETTQVLSNYTKTLTDKLPITRSLRSIALLAPGVTDNGPEGGIGSANTRPALVISGAQSFESLFLVDGAVVNENLRGQPQDLFIEDAIQETTVLSGSVSAEYGRFTGGVVNVATRSGGNQFHGSFRTNFTSDAWRDLDPIEARFDEDPRIQQVDETYEGTLGGALWKDRVWFFAAGRRQDVSDSRYIFLPEVPERGDAGSVLIPYMHSFAENRGEIKLTGNLTASHNLVGAYTAVRSTETNSGSDAGDLGVLDDYEVPHSILTLNYNGVLSSRLFVEAQYSQRNARFVGNGSNYSDFVRGTRIDVDRDFTLNTTSGYDGDPETYGNRSWLAKVSYLMSPEGFGTHDLRIGYEWFRKTVFANYNFSGSGFVVSNAGSILRDNQAYPVFSNDVDNGPARLEWRRIEQGTAGDAFVTQSVFLSDHIQWGRWTLQLGLRYDANDARNSAGRAVSTSDAWSPRLAAQFDASGTGTVLLNGGYARYVAGLHEGIVQVFSEAGQPSLYRWNYTGPCINCDPAAPTDELLTTPEALAIVDAWFRDEGRATEPVDVRIQGVNRLLPTNGLVSPAATEYTFGVGAALGAKGWVRADFLDREYGRFYDNRIDSTTGQVQGPTGPLDIEILENSPTLERRYIAVQTRIDYRFSPQLYAGGSYAWSRLTGNVVGENADVSAALSFVGAYPEYHQESWSYPTGYLPGDQRNRARIWFGGDWSLPFGSVGVSILESYQSGLPYEAVGTISLEGPDGPYLANPGYARPPSSADYFFSSRGQYRTDNIASTDVALTLTARLFGEVDLFVQPQVLNLFDAHGSVAANATVETARDADSYATFNPFTETPVRGVNYDLASSFGTPAAYQPPRTFRFNVGMRF